jgi:hypothetical protein
MKEVLYSKGTMDTRFNSARQTKIEFSPKLYRRV